MKRKLTIIVLTLVTLLALNTTATNAYWIADTRTETVIINGHQYDCYYELRCTESGCWWQELGCDLIF